MDLATTMMGLHEVLERHFFAHQVALLDRDFARAAAALDDYRRRLSLHMRDEESAVLPIYRDLGGDATDAPVRLFLGEHGKMRDFVDDFVRRTASLQRHRDDRALLELLDREATYKNLVLHHDLRERNCLYPHLARHLDAAGVRRVTAAIAWTGGDPS